MKKLILALILVLITLTGCQEIQQKDQVKEEVKQQQTITVTISHFGDEITEKEIEFTEGQTALEVLQSNFDIDDADGFITGVEGIAADETKQEFWSFIVNGEMAMVGAGEYELVEDDSITLDLQNWE